MKPTILCVENPSIISDFCKWLINESHIIRIDGIGFQDIANNYLTVDEVIAKYESYVKERQKKPEYVNSAELATEKLLESFPGSYLLTDREPVEFLADEESNTYFILGDCTTKEDIDCKVLEWLSRAACKTQPYDSDYKNNKFHQKMLAGINKYFGTSFTHAEMMQIYTYLGNAVSHEKTLLFIRNDFDMDILPIKSTMIESNMGKVPLEDYLDIKSQQCGFKDYKDLKVQGFHLNFNNENKTEEIEDIKKE